MVNITLYRILTYLYTFLYFNCSGSTSPLIEPVYILFRSMFLTYLLLFWSFPVLWTLLLTCLTIYIRHKSHFQNSPSPHLTSSCWAPPLSLMKQLKSLIGPLISPSCSAPSLFADITNQTTYPPLSPSTPAASHHNHTLSQRFRVISCDGAGGGAVVLLLTTSGSDPPPSLLSFHLGVLCLRHNKSERGKERDM